MATGCTGYQALHTVKTTVLDDPKNDIFFILMNATVISIILWIYILVTIILSLQPGCTGYHALYTVKTIIYSYLKNDKMIFILMYATVISVILRIVILMTIIRYLQIGCSRFQALHTVKTIIYTHLKNDNIFNYNECLSYKHHTVNLHSGDHHSLFTARLYWVPSFAHCKNYYLQLPKEWQNDFHSNE